MAPMSVAEARTVPIPPMVWGQADPRAYLAEWAGRIAAEDRTSAGQSVGDVHQYRVHKVFKTLNTIRHPRHWGLKV